MNQNLKRSCDNVKQTDFAYPKKPMQHDKISPSLDIAEQEVKTV